MGDGQDGTDDAEGSVFLEGDAAVAAHGVGLEPLGSWDVLGDEKLADFMVETADFGLFHFKLAPRLGIGDGQAFDDLDDFGAASDSKFFQLEVGVGGGVGGLVNTSEDTALTGLSTATTTAGA